VTQLTVRRGPSSVVFESEPGRVDGWVGYRIEDRWPGGLPANLVRVGALYGLTPEADAALWRYCLDLDLAATVRLRDRPLDEPIRWRLADPRRLRTIQVGDQLWLRLLDLPAALAARRYAAEGELVFEVTDALRPTNQGRYRLNAMAVPSREVTFCIDAPFPGWAREPARRLDRRAGANSSLA
jgi:predicted acetyltransferase